MSVEVHSEWTCDWCGTRRQGYSATRCPDGWHAVSLTGVEYKPQRDLCQKCFWAFEKAMMEFKKGAEQFWWSQYHTIEKAPDAKPDSPLD